jgi:hypothetical protein
MSTNSISGSGLNKEENKEEISPRNVSPTPIITKTDSTASLNQLISNI